MIYDFDYFSRYEQPELILCEADDREIGVIQGVSDLKLVINLNEVSTLSYKIYNNDEELTKEGKATDGEEPDVVKDWVPDPAKPNIYRLHKERREVHALGVGYFIITDINEIEDDTGTYKNVSCKSCEYELNNIACPGVALNDVNMYPLYNTESYEMLSNYERFKYLEDITTEEVDEDDTGVYKSDSCILFNLLCYAPTWRLSDETIRKFNEVDKYIALAATMRNLEDEDTTVYSYLKGKVSEAWEIFISFNIENRTIDIYKYEDVLKPSSMVLSEANILDKCEVKSNIDDYVNALSITGGTDDLYISDFTRSGENVIYNFDHDIATGMIYGELKDAILYWSNMTEGDIPLEVPEGAKVPDHVFPDFYYDYEGNDLYRFLYGSRNALEKWSEAYEKNSGKGEEYKVNLTPPSIAVAIGGSWTSSGQDTPHFDENVNGQYCLTITRALAIDTDDTEESNADTLTVYFDGNIQHVDYSPNSNETTTSAQAAAIAATLNNSELFREFFTAEIDATDDSSIIITQVTPGNGVPGFSLGNNRKNIEGSYTITIKTVGHAAGKASFEVYEYVVQDDGWTYGIKNAGIEWSESFLYGNRGASLKISDCRKVLQYFNEEKLIADDCLTFATNYRQAFETQKKVLDEKRSTSEYADETEAAVLRKQYENVLMYIDVAKSLELAYSSIANQIATWVGTVEQMLDETNYKRTFQGAFKEFCKERYPELADDDKAIEDKVLLLYNRLIRVLKQQKYQDTSIVITDTMTMYEKYQQEQELYNKGVSTLAKLIQPSAEISIDAEPFMFSSEYGVINDNVKMGYCIYVELPNGEVPLYHLKQITVDYQAPSCQLVFGDRIRSNDPADIFGDLQKAASTAANIVASERIDWGVNSSRVNYLMKEKDADIVTTMRAMENSVNNVTIDQNGLSCFSINPITNLEEYGFWGANGSLMFFDYDPEVGRVPRVAIGRIYKAGGGVEYGFWGDKIIANSITAEKLAVGAISNGSNYIRNGSFEGVNGVVGQSGTVSYWKNGTDPSTSVPIDAVAYRAEADGSIIPYMQVGDECAKITAARTIAQTTDALSGDTYVLSFYYLFANSGSQMSYTIDTHSTGGTYSKSLAPDSTNTKKWAKEVCKITVQDGHEVTVSFNCTNGTGYVDAVMLSKGSNIQVEYSPHVSEVYAKYTAINEDGVNIYGGHLAIYDAEGHKKIYTQGQNLIVSGNILADYIEANTAGSIAGWKINSDLIYKSVPIEGSDQDKKPTGWSSNSSYPAFWAGSDMITIPSTTIPAWSTYPEGFNSTGSTASGHGANFMLLHDGRLFARNADITGAIHATSLTLGSQNVATEYWVNNTALDGYATEDWVRDEIASGLDVDLGGWLVTTDQSLHWDLSNYFVYLYGKPSDENNWVIRCGSTDPKTKGSAQTAFGVTADGKVFCRGAQVSGDIICNNLTAGTITVTNGGNAVVSGGTTLGGSWTIGANTLYTTVGASDGSDYTLNNKNRFMLTADGDAISLGSFYTMPRAQSSLGIKISNYDIAFKYYGRDIDEGALSFASDGNGTLAISAKYMIGLGQKVSGNNIDYKVILDNSNNTLRPEYGETINLGNANTSGRWNTLYVKNIDMTGSITGLSFSSLSVTDLTADSIAADSISVDGILTSPGINANNVVINNSIYPKRAGVGEIGNPSNYFNQIATTFVVLYNPTTQQYKHLYMDNNGNLTFAKAD